MEIDKYMATAKKHENGANTSAERGIIMTKSELTNDELIVIEALRAFPEFGDILKDILKIGENHHSELESK